MNNLVNALPAQWSGDILEQNNYIDLLRTYLENALTGFDAKKSYTVLLTQTTEPTQGQWETAYTAQTGNAIPIPSQTQLIWWNSNSNTFGGLYGTTPLNSTVYARFGLNSRNTVQYSATQFLTSTFTDTHAILSNLSRYPVLTFTLARTSNIDVYYQCYSTITGTGAYGADILSNGTKLGTSLYGLAANRGIIELSGTGLLALRMFVPNVAPGTYTYQVACGYTGTPGTPPSVAIANRQLIIKATAV